ncbi:alpha-ketoglutarate-dependent dioxygenase alkB homolog 7, mitochondrial [Agrilus planipennis]|uniref:Alpha-ketoglutarate-dependent dioxygenase alkB homolog 7, mitochondrial n=1 Tax=Agrilus planipennis TaxID=224129 RepID=A0A7F5R085_AGRPL|nr:alpha-ketoglutarate-dependent dioxygenase alkB homolog 7, mitochondrial [Agrilus planipennis]
MYRRTVGLFAKRIISKNVRSFSAVKPAIQEECPSYLELSEAFSNHDKIKTDFVNSMIIHKDFLSEVEEKSLLDQVEPRLKTLRYQFDHWDDAIHGYRETEILHWNEANTQILSRVRQVAFPPGVPQLDTVHILDLDEKGVIKPHIDSVRFCGNTIAGLSLLTESVMKLVHEKYKDLIAKVHLTRRSLYIMKDSARYDYKHELLKNSESIFKNSPVIKTRRISIICRNEPDKEMKN